MSPTSFNDELIKELYKVDAAKIAWSQNRPQWGKGTKAQFRRRTFHEPNLIP